MDMHEFFGLRGVHPEDWADAARRKLNTAFRALEGTARHVFANELFAVFGDELILMKAGGVLGEFGWDDFRKRLRLPRRRLEDIMAVGRFARQAPRLFAHLKILDPVEMIRIARLGPEIARELYPEAAINEEI